MTETIVIFGAGVLAGGQPSPTLRGRVDAAFGCGGLSARYLPTGAVGRHGPSKASVMAGLLVAHGVPAGQIWLEETGTDTLSSALACARMLAGEMAGAAGPVRVCSSGFHLLRCLMLMRMAGVQVTACPAPPSAGWAVWYWRLRECVAVPYDAVVMLMRRHE